MDEEETLQAVTELSSMSDHFTDLFSVTLTIHHETCCPVGVEVKQQYQPIVF